MADDPYQPERGMPDLLRMRKVDYQKIDVPLRPTLADLEAAVLTQKAGDKALMQKFVDMLVASKKD